MRSYRTEDNTDIIVTGSNSRMLSSELSTLLHSYPKHVISATPLLRASDYNGVTHLSLRKFLTEGLGND